MGQAASCWCLMMMGWGRGSAGVGGVEVGVVLKGERRWGGGGGPFSLTPSCPIT